VPPLGIFSGQRNGGRHLCRIRDQTMPGGRVLLLPMPERMKVGGTCACQSATYCLRDPNPRHRIPVSQVLGANARYHNRLRVYVYSPARNSAIAAIPDRNHSGHSGDRIPRQQHRNRLIYSHPAMVHSLYDCHFHRVLVSLSGWLLNFALDCWMTFYYIVKSHSAIS